MPSTVHPSESLNRADLAVEMLTALPFASHALPGTGGVIKATPEHFRVEERLPYAPVGQGEHVYITFRRSGWNTADAAEAMRRRLDLAPPDVGWGGRKDRTAVVVQTISLRCGPDRPLDEIAHALADLPFDILALDRHRNKIKTGHVAANRFRIVVSGVHSDALTRARAIAGRLKQVGVPNFYGPQRFGHGWRNIHRGFGGLAAGKKSRRDPFMVSVVQSALFNIWLEQRMAAGDYRRIMAGDVAQKTDTGGMFTVEDPSHETRRFDMGAIVYTGPIYGYKMRSAGGSAGKAEASLLARFDLTAECFRRLRAPGSRRPAILYLADLSIVDVPEGLRFTFTLPSGAYATTVLREFMKNE